MEYLTDKEISFIVKLIGDKADVQNDANKLKLLGLASKVSNLTNNVPKLNVSPSDYDDTNEVLKRLKVINEEYAKSRDMQSIVTFDILKKDLAGDLQYLVTMKVKFEVEYLRLKDYLEEKFLPDLIYALMENKEDEQGRKMNKSYAETLALRSDNYQRMKKIVNQVKGHSILLTESYNYYTKELSFNIGQSITTARREKTDSNFGNTH